MHKAKGILRIPLLLELDEPGQVGPKQLLWRLVAMCNTRVHAEAVISRSGHTVRTDLAGHSLAQVIRTEG